MQNYAVLTLLHGICNSLGLSEIQFRYPLQTAHEKGLNQKTIFAITHNPFQLRYYWSLVNGSEYEAFVQACAIISDEHKSPIIVPVDVMHGSIKFQEIFRFDGYSLSSKERLVQQLVDIGISPSNAALDFSYQSSSREMERLYGHIDRDRLAHEERLAFASNLSFHTEE